jgi:enediyne biosynthesis protein E4
MEFSHPKNKPTDMKLNNVWWLLCLAVITSCSDKKSENGEAPAQLFQLLDAEQTKVDFINDVKDGENFNILTYRNFYNGGGVAIGDINNDSLPDLYFTANQKKNKLYLNKGNLVFEDITDKAGVGGTMEWSTGVTMADVNGDGYLDIYVCNSGDVDRNNKKNELFINNGNLTFTEKAKDYNLDNEGFTTHAAFFDYDQDGDLDCYILNNSFRDPAKIELYRAVRQQASPGGHKLMRNDGNTFTDVTAGAGIYSSDIAFGLGVAVSDLNGDHLPDIYISNDFWERDYLYINKGNGKFSEELTSRINYCSTSSMGADIADINNDGSPEIFTTDMLPGDNWRLKTTMAFDPYHLEDLKYRANYHYQITQNCLQLNNGTADFEEIGLLSGVAATDWSWGALIFDFENDGNKDIFVSNGILKDIMSMDFHDFLANEVKGYTVNSKGTFDYRKFIATIPTQPLQNYAFSNVGNLSFTNNAAQLGLPEKSYSNGAAYGDLDNDGDEDLVVNNINAKCFIYRNDADKNPDNHYLKIRFQGTEKNRFGIGAEVKLKLKDSIEVLQNYNTRGFQSSVEPQLLFGLGENTNVDSLTVTWPDGKVQVLINVKSNQTITLKNSDAAVSPAVPAGSASPLFVVTNNMIEGDATHHENRYNDFDDEILLVRMLSTEGPRLIRGDVNKDNLEDFVLLGATGDPCKLFIQQSGGSFRFRPNTGFENDKFFESTCGAFIDYDKDGDADLVIGSGGNQPGVNRANFLLRLYLNNGTGTFSPAPGAIPPVIGNFSTVEAGDIDNDGDDDLFLGARNVPGNYGLPPRSYLLVNDRGVWTDIAPQTLGNIGMVTDAAWSDIDKDGDKDLIVVGDWMAVHIFYNENGTFDNQKIIPNSSGWWNRIEAADLDGDGDDDYVLGNWGLNTKFKATPARPLTMYVKDFDGNGKSEFIINWYAPLDSIAYPFATKQELTSQVPSLKKQILKYEDYGNKTYEMLFTPEQRSNALKYETNYLESAIMWNNNGNIELHALPLEAQLSPVFGIVVDDLDGDGKKDIWLGGNFYELKPQAGRHNASKGLLLKQIDNRGFKYISNAGAGITVTGEVRDAAVINNELLVARNNDKVLLFKKN